MALRRPTYAARAALGAHAPGQHDLLGIVGQPVRQLRAQLFGQREHALDVGLGGAWPHDPLAGLAAQQQVQRVGEHGLPGAGLAGQDVQPLAQAQLGPFDQEQVLDAKLFQHEGGCITGVRRSPRVSAPPRASGAELRRSCHSARGSRRASKSRSTTRAAAWPSSSSQNVARERRVAVRVRGAHGVEVAQRLGDLVGRRAAAGPAPSPTKSK